ncbi:hypothetical protein CUZ56_01547 [Saezia sanguinis]|uniref:Uncharacterized protein n=1 Tax=Saezia sanguinis TaxID=1965230 RepID=A0A433SDI4_9BURK|nr:hypothetical protein [Saezia sanguinis]RUS66756.1 hypothetical protein CUZ56_01547 [Saezia sanguinis]
MVMHPHDAKKPRSSQDPLWNVFDIIQHYFYREDGSVNHDDQQATKLVINCMFDLLARLQPDELTAHEKVGIFAAQQYWLQGANELAPLMISISNAIESKITYRRPAVDNRLSCVMQILSVDSDHFNDFPEFLENIRYAGLTDNEIVAVVGKHFSFIPQVKAFKV